MKPVKLSIKPGIEPLIKIEVEGIGKVFKIHKCLCGSSEFASVMVAGEESLETYRLPKGNFQTVYVQNLRDK
jgi:hypothetical protein